MVLMVFVVARSLAWSASADQTRIVPFFSLGRRGTVKIGLDPVPQVPEVEKLGVIISSLVSGRGP